MANVFKEAKKIHKAHPRMPWKECVKKAGRRVSGTKRKTHKKTVRGVHHKKAHHRRRVSGVSRSPDRGADNKKVDISIGSITTSQAERLAVNKLKEANAWMYVSKDSVKTKSGKRKILKKIAANNQKIRALEK